MDLYFNLLPSDIISIIISHFNSDDLFNFIKLNKYLINSIDWGNIFFLQFNYYKNVSYIEYLGHLNIKKLKEKLFINESIQEILDLKELVSDNNQIEEIPKEIGNLINLQFLSLTNNKIIELPKEIGNLFNLQILYLGYNKIKEIPKEIGGLTSLKFLYLGYNKIKELPREIGNLINLKVLYLNHNPINLDKLKIKNLFSQKLTIYL